MEAKNQDSQHQEEHKRTENKRLKEGTGHSIKDEVQRIGGDLKFQKNPEFIAERKKIFEELIAV
jgi:hypothetical protein